MAAISLGRLNKDEQRREEEETASAMRREPGAARRWIVVASRCPVAVGSCVWPAS